MDIAADKVTAFIDHVRMLDVREGDTDPASGSNAIDDGMTDVLVGSGEADGTAQELRSFISGLNTDEQANLVALVWIGRGDFEPEEFAAAVRAARERREGSTAAYLLGIPNVSDLVEEGLAALEAAGEAPEPRTPEERAAPPRGLHPELDETASAPPPERDPD